MGNMGSSTALSVVMGVYGPTTATYRSEIPTTTVKIWSVLVLLRTQPESPSRGYSLRMSVVG